MCKYPNLQDQIIIDERKLLPVKKVLDQKQLEKKIKREQEIKSDCDTIKNELITLINEDMPKNINNIKDYNYPYITGKVFNLKFINSLNSIHGYYGIDTKK